MTADIAAGAVAAAQVFARQAQDAGVTVNVKQIPVGEFYGEQYLQWTFAQDFWMYAPYLSQVARALLPDGVYNETHFNDEEFNRLYVEAQATVDPALHCEIIGKMQEIDFTRGGFIIPSFNQVIDLMSDKVEGFVPGAAGYPLGNYGFQRAWMA
jgi:peptide/nickel transport system substrate-binding protein